MTEEIEAIAKRLVVGRKRDGRSIYDPQARRDLVQACRQPGVSLAKVARSCGINANVLSNWVRLHERGPGVSAAGGEVIEMPAAPAFVAVQLDHAPQAPLSSSRMELQAKLPNGVTLDLQVGDLDGATRLIEILGRLRCCASTKP